MSLEETVAHDQSRYEIPQSRGVPPMVRLFFGVSIVVIFFMGAISVRESSSFHVWPAANVAKAPLSGSFGR